MANLPVKVDFFYLLARIAVTIIVSFILVKILSRLLTVAERRLKVKEGLLLQIRRFFQLVIYSAAGILILWMLNVDVTGLVAGLGVGALVIGFALKDIIENWVSGLLLISGKSYRIGDMIRVGDLTGRVTDISLRTTKLETYDKNEIIIPNSTLLRERIVNLTGGTRETVTSITFSIDYIFNIERTKEIIKDIVKGHPDVIVNEKRRREIRFLVRSKEWTTEIETLFWIDDPEDEEFTKSQITEEIKKKLEEKNILPPLGLMRREFLESKNTLFKRRNS